MSETERDWLEGRDARTQAALEAEWRERPQSCGRLDAHARHNWFTPYGGPYHCPGSPVTEGGRTRCPGCLTSGVPHPVGGDECRETAREKAISQGDE